MADDTVEATGTTGMTGTVDEPAPVSVADVLIEDVLVEEVSIDGMCGVY